MKTLSDKELRKQIGKMQGIAKNFLPICRAIRNGSVCPAASSSIIIRIELFCWCKSIKNWNRPALTLPKSNSPSFRLNDC